jgi:hypothetical protein
VQSSIACVCFLAASSQVQAQAILANPSINSNPSSKTAWHDTVPDKLISAKVHDGMLTVDGMVAKVQLNYDIDNASYMYFFVPGVGTAVISLSPLADSVKVKNAFDGSKLAFTANGHSFELTSEGDLLGKDKSDAYVHFDGSTVALARTPRMGFGKTLQPPYAWPLSTVPTADKEAHLIAPPAIPASMLPAMKAPKADAQPTASGSPAPAPAASPAPATAAEPQPVAPQAAQQQ